MPAGLIARLKQRVASWSREPKEDEASALRFFPPRRIPSIVRFPTRFDDPGLEDQFTAQLAEKVKEGGKGIMILATVGQFIMLVYRGASHHYDNLANPVQLVIFLIALLTLVFCISGVFVYSLLKKPTSVEIFTNLVMIVMTTSIQMQSVLRIGVLFSQTLHDVWPDYSTRPKLAGDDLVIVNLAVCITAFYNVPSLCRNRWPQVFTVPAVYLAFVLLAPEDPADQEGTAFRFSGMIGFVFWLQSMVGFWGASSTELSMRREFEQAQHAKSENAAMEKMLSIYNDSTICISHAVTGEWTIIGADRRFQGLLGCDVQLPKPLNDLLDPVESAKVSRAIASSESLPSLCATTLQGLTGARAQVDLCFVPRRKIRSHARAAAPGPRQIVPMESEKDHVASTGPGCTFYLVGIRLASQLEPGAYDGAELSDAVGLAAKSQAIADRGIACDHLDDVESHVSRSVESVALTTRTGRLFKNGIVDGCGLIALGKQEHWYIESGHLKIDELRVLGKGGFGVVVEAEYFGSRVAVKRAKLHNVTQESFMHELRMCRWMNHPNLVYFLGANLSPELDEASLVFELIRGPTLDHFIRCNSAWDLQTLVVVLLGIVHGLCYLHGQYPPIVHSDIKPANIFVDTADKATRAKLGDMGIARRCKPGAEPFSGGTTRWMAPELLISSLPPSTASDAFSFGRVAYFVATRQRPMHQLTDTGIKDMIRGGIALPPNDWPNSSIADWCQQQAEACLQDERERRPPLSRVRVELLKKAKHMCSTALRV